MRSKYMRFKKLVIPMLTVIIMINTMTGCATINKDEAEKLLNESSQIEIVIPEYNNEEIKQFFESQGKEFETHYWVNVANTVPLATHESVICPEVDGYSIKQLLDKRGGIYGSSICITGEYYLLDTLREPSRPSCGRDGHILEVNGGLKDYVTRYLTFRKEWHIRLECARWFPEESDRLHTKLWENIYDTQFIFEDNYDDYDGLRMLQKKSEFYTIGDFVNNKCSISPIVKAGYYNDMFIEEGEQIKYDLDTYKIARLNIIFNLLPMFKDKSFRPTENVTRKEAMNALFRSTNTPNADNMELDQFYTRGLDYVQPYNKIDEFTEETKDDQLAKYASQEMENSYLTYEDKSLNYETFNANITKGEVVYMIMKKIFYTDMNKIEIGKEEALKDAKNAGDMKAKYGLNSQEEVLRYMLEHPEDGMDEQIYKALVVARNYGIIDSKTEWYKPINRVDFMKLLIKAYMADPYMEKIGWDEDIYNKIEQYYNFEELYKEQIDKDPLVKYTVNMYYIRPVGFGADTASRLPTDSTVPDRIRYKFSEEDYKNFKLMRTDKGFLCAVDKRTGVVFYDGMLSPYSLEEFNLGTHMNTFEMTYADLIEVLGLPCEEVGYTLRDIQYGDDPEITRSSLRIIEDLEINGYHNKVTPNEVVKRYDPSQYRGE